MAIIHTGPSEAGININRGTFASGQAIIAGSFADAGGTGVEFAGNELIEIHGTVGSATEDHAMVRLRNCGYESGPMTTGTVLTLQLHAYGGRTGLTGQHVNHIHALEAHTGIKGDSQLLASAKMRAGYFKCEDLGYDLTAAASSIICPIWGEMQFNAGTATSGTVHWIHLANYGSLTGTWANAVFYLEELASGKMATNLFQTNRAMGMDPFKTGDLVPAHDPDASSIGCDAYAVNDFNGTPYYIPLYNSKV